MVLKDDLADNQRLTRLDPQTNKRLSIKLLVQYDFRHTLDRNISDILEKIDFNGSTRYAMCMERTLVNKPWDAPKKESMIDLHTFREDSLLSVIIDREMYYLVPKSLIGQCSASSSSKSSGTMAIKESQRKNKGEFPIAKIQS